MTKTITSFIKGLKTAQLIALYNMAQAPETWKGTGKPSGIVKKFADRATAEKRMVKLMSGWDDSKTTFAGYNEFYGDFAHGAHAIGIEMPTPEEDVVQPKPAAATKAAPAAKTAKKATKKAEGDAPAKQKTPPHLNLRCPHLACGYYAKTTPFWLAKGRLLCPMDKSHGRLETAEERGEKRGHA